MNWSPYIAPQKGVSNKFFTEIIVVGGRDRKGALFSVEVLDSADGIWKQGLNQIQF